MTGLTILKIVIILVAAPLAGGFLTGLDRKISAHMQGRMGPPVVQPFYDVIKLFGKERIAVNSMQDVYALGLLLFSAAALVMLFLGRDILMMMFVMAFGDISLILGAMSVRSPYSKIGANREIIQMMATEPVLLLTAVGVYLTTGSFLISGIPSLNRPLLASLPLLFVALLVALTVKLRKSPFDFSSSQHAHQELIQGVNQEFSGAQLAVIEIAHWVELILLLGVVSLFYMRPWWAGILLALAAYFAEILLDNISARTSWRWMLKIAGAFGLGLAVLNLAILYLRPLFG